jgi:hypothetical protein
MARTFVGIAAGISAIAHGGCALASLIGTIYAQGCTEAFRADALQLTVERSTTARSSTRRRTNADDLVARRLSGAGTRVAEARFPEVEGRQRPARALRARPSAASIELQQRVVGQTPDAHRHARETLSRARRRHRCDMLHQGRVTQRRPRTSAASAISRSAGSTALERRRHRFKLRFNGAFVTQRRFAQTGAGGCCAAR